MVLEKYMKTNQSGLDSYIAEVTVKDLVSNYRFDVHSWSLNRDGYQHSPYPVVSMEIANTIISTFSHLHVPIHFIGAIDVAKLINDNEVLHLQDELRIVAGHDWVKGFEYAMQKLEAVGNIDLLTQLQEFKIPITIMVIDESKGQKLHEIDMFIGTNRGIWEGYIDTAMEVRGRVFPETLLVSTDEDSLIEEITDSVVLEINNGDECYRTPWKDEIRIDSKDTSKAVTMLDFSKSLKPVVREMLKHTRPIQTKEDARIVVSVLKDLIIGIWWDIKYQWDEATKEYGSNNYLIQQLVGVKAFHHILENCVPELNVTDVTTGDRGEDLKVVANKVRGNFRLVIENSGIKDEDWLLDGLFSGLDLEDDYKSVANYLSTGEF
ncbi:hypothetical protein FT641_18425 [Bacillus paranthracis]|uniref:hypothetical protein n=1 Tax=Bacillus paranthracis TaxID=2026186 RepID=UPI0018793024|nr:hypothetical protein [Bacillus paranthracis]MBE7114460.1 hypothetical protein [Bacillus paranthracis]MBE7154666.1 hypothetical protein [Bacillus paranthracis]